MLQEPHKLKVYATRIAQTKSLCYKNRTNWKFMLQEPHKLEVYATRIAQTGSLCYKNRTNWKFMLQESPKLEVYATRTRTKNWKFMLQESHKLEVYATRTAQTGSLCYKKETFSIRNGIIFSVGACCARDTSYRSITAE